MTTTGPAVTPDISASKLGMSRPSQRRLDLRPHGVDRRARLLQHPLDQGAVDLLAGYRSGWPPYLTLLRFVMSGLVRVRAPPEIHAADEHYPRLNWRNAHHTGLINSASNMLSGSVGSGPPFVAAITSLPLPSIMLAVELARAANARGDVIGKWEMGTDETYADFIVRSKHGAKAIDAARLIVGGIPDLAAIVPSSIRPASRTAIVMPDGALHAGQVDALKVIQNNRFTALRAGRRFGKSSLAAALATDLALLGGVAGVFAPIYRLAAPLFDVLAAALVSVTATSNRSIGELRVIGGGGVDVWPLERPRAGRGRRYNLVVIDEAAFAEPELDDMGGRDSSDLGRHPRGGDRREHAERRCRRQLVLAHLQRAVVRVR
jgi:hypothetical protein